MKFCEIPCAGCPIDPIKNRERREAARKDIKRVFDALTYPTIRSLAQSGELDTAVENICQDTPETPEWELEEDYDPAQPVRQIDVRVVAAAVSRIATDQCTEARVPSVITSN
ncbi:hypothetical protein A3E49_02865 [Candidatus Saccharibacteria bacterium RIFCSPHIGHO2_12_FULL_49_19]|nr:MAG: hypothetical protein A2708_00230 [Candidatus Saccharibacteria bacterium RIFCSPHIGHO2_01_FULL_49_21]OGL37272.1 MAG: hypothetical protein A3E49_02865 [Candidatus Saccharibacteria bacterium RIFCSPHIGHO2_12_FULL_49_19]OGL37631.1 MAG: hypothetical protein A3B63_03205 [Candidatus Saccharibacteria bacterium RIFCSPLOWO2_01_FULL_49_22]